MSQAVLEKERVAGELKSARDRYLRATQQVAEFEEANALFSTFPLPLQQFDLPNVSAAPSTFSAIKSLASRTARWRPCA